MEETNQDWTRFDKEREDTFWSRQHREREDQIRKLKVELADNIIKRDNLSQCILQLEEEYEVLKRQIHVFQADEDTNEKEG